MTGASKRRIDVDYMIQSPKLQDQHGVNHGLYNANGGKMSQTGLQAYRSSDNIQQYRSLPPRNLSDETFDDTYVAFVLYCNPAIPLNTDTSELRKVFRAPPRSDGKLFNPFTLFGLIRRLVSKEIRSWAQLAVELGVEPPALDKGQSAQKVQQYAVRLKRWMHAMHVDAFFEWLLGKSHVYWTKVPSLTEPCSDSGRDGVPADEDLALRALLPETRPKRGRRKADDTVVNDRDNESDVERTPAAQRPRLDSPIFSECLIMARASLLNGGTTPASAHPGLHNSFHTWSAVEGRFPLADSFNWHATLDNVETPTSAYPRTAMTPTFRQTAPWNENPEPQSALTPSKPKARRRNPPTVSSAWPSNGTSSTGRLRGRPPSNRTSTDGSYSTFPAKPKNAPLTNETPTFAPHILNGSEASQLNSTPPISMTLSSLKPPTPNSRPTGLQLQVPQRQGGSVRLVTPPQPSLSVHDGTHTPSHDDTMEALPQSALSNSQITSKYNYSTVHKVNFQIKQLESFDQGNLNAIHQHLKLEVLTADWLDASGNQIQRCTIDEADKICKELIETLKAESNNYENFLLRLSLLIGGSLTSKLTIIRLETQVLDTELLCHRAIKSDAAEGELRIRVAIRREAPMPQINGDNDTEASWKQKYLDLQREMREKEDKVRSGVLDALLASGEFKKT